MSNKITDTKTTDQKTTKSGSPVLHEEDLDQVRGGADMFIKFDGVDGECSPIRTPAVRDLSS